MAALDDLVVVCVVGFVMIAALSLMVTKTPAIPPFARRAPTSGNPQLRQDLNAGFLHDRGFLFRRRVWFVGTCCPPVRIDGPATANSPPIKDSTQCPSHSQAPASGGGSRIPSIGSQAAIRSGMS